MDTSDNLLRWVGGVAIATALVVVAGIYTIGSEPSEGVAGESEKAVELVSHQGEVEEGRPSRVTGTVRNTSRQELGRVKVEISFYDESGAQIGETTAQTSGLGPGKEWRFEVPVPNDYVARYEIERVTWQ
jgi:hypothetical protein